MTDKRELGQEHLEPLTPGVQEVIRTAYSNFRLPKNHIGANTTLGTIKSGETILNAHQRGIAEHQRRTQQKY